MRQSVEDRLAALEQAIFGVGHNHVVQGPDPILAALRNTYALPRLKLHILRYLLVNPFAQINTLVTIAEEVVGSHAENPIGNIRSHISQMRRVLERDGILIEAVPGIGYRLGEQSKTKLRERCGLSLRKSR